MALKIKLNFMTFLTTLNQIRIGKQKMWILANGIACLLNLDATSLIIWNVVIICKFTYILNDFTDTQICGFLVSCKLAIASLSTDNITHRSSENEHFSANRRLKRKLNQNDAIKSTFSTLLPKKAGYVNAWRGKNMRETGYF